MKPKLLKISLLPQQSFSIRQDAVPHFFSELHFHPEIELVHIKKGSGTQFVGSHLQNFSSGDMIMVGSNLPHLWKCADEYFEGNTNLQAEATVIHFLPDCFGNSFFDLPENIALLKLLNKSKLGLSIHKKTKSKVVELMSHLRSATGSNKVILLLQILETIANSNQTAALNKMEITQLQTGKELSRMNIILQHLLDNYTEGIELKKIAGIANMSPNAFCRYFKTRTKKTFSTFLTELRINHSCKLLLETDKSISEICYESGFNNFSNFNRYFKLLTTYTPLQYRKKHME